MITNDFIFYNTAQDNWTLRDMRGSRGSFSAEKKIFKIYKMRKLRVFTNINWRLVVVGEWSVGEM